MNAVIRERRQRLWALRNLLTQGHDELVEALARDLNKSPLEAFTAELALVHNEIRHALRHLSSWTRPRRPAPEWFLWPASLQVRKEPLGRVLILAPWNYPVQLLLGPLVAALAAGNQVVLKPSEEAVHTEAVLSRLIPAFFAPEWVSVVTGGPDRAARLLEEGFDFIFFTGSRTVGQRVLASAATTLTPAVVELGGKSPALVDATVSLRTTAEKIVWGKFSNAGQTCIAPDYVLIEASVRDRFVDELRAAIQRFFGPDPQTSPHYGRLISTKHFDRLTRMFEGAHVLAGGRSIRPERYWEPTLVNGDWEHPLMQDEIFGPILPLVTFTSAENALELAQRLPTPLAAYFFSRKEETLALWQSGLKFGNAGVNSTLFQFTSAQLPFGGAGPSGFGRSHGKAGFDAFSRETSILRQPSWWSSRFVYPPRPWPVRWFRTLFRG